MAETVKVDLYDANKGKAERTGGPYLDEIVAEQAEIQRAKREGREPDLDNPGPTAATQLVPKSYLRETDTDKSHFSDRVEVEYDPVTTVEVELPESKPDPNQVDFNNDYSVLNALKAKEALEQVNVTPAEQSEEAKIVAESEAKRNAANENYASVDVTRDETSLVEDDKTDDELFGDDEK